MKTERRLHTIWRIPDDLWTELQPLLPPEKPPGTRGRPAISFRQITDGILYVLRTGCPLRAISGLMRLTSGTITFGGTNIGSLPPYKVTELGIAHVPEGRQVFPEMTVRENLEMGAYIPSAKAQRNRTLDLVFSIFPVLAERRWQLAGTMSGGEQQMLAIGRGLMLQLLMLDEPSLGLAPVMTDATFDKIQEIHSMGMTILLVEQNVSRALTLVQRAYVLESGKVVMQGASAELANNKQLQAAYLGI